MLTLRQSGQWALPAKGWLWVTWIQANAGPIMRSSPSIAAGTAPRLTTISTGMTRFTPAVAHAVRTRWRRATTLVTAPIRQGLPWETMALAIRWGLRPARNGLAAATWMWVM